MVKVVKYYLPVLWKVTLDFPKKAVKIGCKTLILNLWSLGLVLLEKKTKSTKLKPLTTNVNVRTYDVNLIRSS